MTTPQPESPPNTPNHQSRTFSFGAPNTQTAPSCHCGNQTLVPLCANTLADTLGVSPLYKQQDSARWTAAAQVYRSSRAHSPTQDDKFFDSTDTLDPTMINSQKVFIPPRTPLSLEEIANANRKRHGIEGGVLSPNLDRVGPLELEAIAAVHELALEVKDISVSEMLPRTSDLIFVNVKTQEDQPFTLELTMKGWRIASSHTDCMNGDYTKVDLHVRYFKNARELLNFVSPDHTTRFNECVAEKLSRLQDAITAQ